jgi:Peptidase family M50
VGQRPGDLHLAFLRGGCADEEPAEDGVVFGGIATAIGLLAGLTLTFGVFAWLAGINLVLALFNILPAAPLDGGRLLRAALWKRRGDRVWAAIIAARAGRALDAVLIGVGLCQPLFTRTGFGGIWLAASRKLTSGPAPAMRSSAPGSRGSPCSRATPPNIHRVMLSAVRPRRAAATAWLVRVRAGRRRTRPPR